MPSPSPQTPCFGFCAFCSCSSATGVWIPATNLTIWTCQLCTSFWSSPFFPYLAPNTASATDMTMDNDNNHSDHDLSTPWMNPDDRDGFTSSGNDYPELSINPGPSVQWTPRGADPEINPPFHQFAFDDRLHRELFGAAALENSVSVLAARETTSTSSQAAHTGPSGQQQVQRPSSSQDDSIAAGDGGNTARQTQARRFQTDARWKYTFLRNYGVCASCRMRKHSCLPSHLPREVLVKVPQKTWDECPRADWLVNLN